MSASEAAGELPLELRDGLEPYAPGMRSNRTRRFSPARADRPVRPGQVFDRGLQHERTALAWERTAISMMVAGVLLARYATQSLHWAFATVGLLEVAFGGGLLVWAGRHYDDLHGPLRAGQTPAHPDATRLIGLVAIASCGVATALALVIALGD